MGKSLNTINGFDCYSALHALEYLKQQEQIHYSWYKPNPIQFQFHKLGKEGARDRLIMAANRFGKSTAGLVETSAHLTGNYPLWWPGYEYRIPIDVWVACVDEKAVLDLERKFFKGGEFPATIHESLVYKNDYNKHIHLIKNKYGGLSQFEFKTYQQRREAYQYKRLHLLWGDEEPPMDIYVESSLRLMSTSPSHYTMGYFTATCLYEDNFTKTFTTETVEYSEYDDFIGQDVIKQKTIQRAPGEVNKGYAFITAGWDDASYLTEDEKARMLQKIPVNERGPRTKGIPSVGGGMVYPIMRHLITCDPFEIPNHFYIGKGIDFGWVDPTAVVFGALDRDKDILYLFEEYSQNERTPQQHLFEMSKMRSISEFVYHHPYAGDPSGGSRSQKDGESLFKLYDQCGVKITPANNSREPGVQTVLQRMQNGKLKIFNTCVKLLSEIGMYARDDKTKQVRDGNDHLVDAMRYLVMSGLDIAKPKLNYKNSFYNNNSYNNYPRGTGFM